MKRTKFINTKNTETLVKYTTLEKCEDWDCGRWEVVPDDMWYIVYEYIGIYQLIELFKFYLKNKDESVKCGCGCIFTGNHSHSKAIIRHIKNRCHQIVYALPRMCTGRIIKVIKSPQPTKIQSMENGHCVHPKNATGHYSTVFVPQFDSRTSFHISETHFASKNRHTKLFVKKKYKLCSVSKAIQYPSTISVRNESRRGLRGQRIYSNVRKKLNNNPMSLFKCTIKCTHIIKPVIGEKLTEEQKKKKTELKRNLHFIMIHFVPKCVNDIIKNYFDKEEKRYCRHPSWMGDYYKPYIRRYFYWIMNLDKSGDLLTFIIMKCYYGGVSDSKVLVVIKEIIEEMMMNVEGINFALQPLYNFSKKKIVEV